MAPFCVSPFFPQICVSIELDNHQDRMGLECRGDRARGEGVFTSEQKRRQIPRKKVAACFRDEGVDSLGIFRVQTEISEVSEGARGQVPVKGGRVGFKAIGYLPDSIGSQGGSLPERGGLIERNAEKSGPARNRFGGGFHVGNVWRRTVHISRRLKSS